MAFSKLYLGANAAPYTPPTIRGAWDDTSGAITKELTPSPTSGPITFVQKAETNASTTWDVLLYRGVSGKLAAQTISGTVDIIIASTEQNADADFFWHVHIYVTTGDTDTPRGTLLTDYVENTTNEWTTSTVGRGLQSAQTLSSLGISDGDRLVVEIGYIARNALTASRNGAMYYGTISPTSGIYEADLAVSGTEFADRAATILFSSSISELITESRVTQLGAEGLILGGGTVRVTQLGAEALLLTTTETRITQLGVEALIDNVVPDITLPETGLGLTWVEIRDSANAMRVHAKVALPDPAGYFYGYKQERVKKWGTLSRALSDRTGQYEAVDFSWIQQDLDRNERARLAALTTRYFRNSPVILRMIDEPSWRLQKQPRTILRGYMSSYRPMPGLGFEFKAQDLMSTRFASAGQAPAKVPKRLITETDFADAPITSLNKGVPIIYSQVTDVGGAGTEPATGPVLLPLNGVPGGYYPYGLGLQGPEMGGTGAASYDAQHRSFGVLPGTVPTNPSVTAQAGGSLPASRNDSWSVMVTAVRAGVESDPSPVAQTNINIASGQQSLLVQWTAASGGAPDSYNVYVANNPFGVLTTFSTYFTAFHVASDYTYVYSVGGGVTSLLVSAPGAAYTFQRAKIYKITAVLADLTESPASGEVVALTHPYRRPTHLRWYPYSGAIGYKIYRGEYPGIGTAVSYDTTFTVASTGQTGVQTIDGVSQLEFFDALDGTGETVALVAPPPGGQVKPIPVGTEVIAGIRWTRLLVAGHACKSFGNVYRAGARVAESVYGVSLLVPGKPGWPHAQNYITINGHRYAVIYALNEYAAGHLDGSKPLTLNPRGIETVGDGSGTEITQIHDQYLHALKNWILGDYQSGAWLTSPEFEDQPGLKQIDEDSFATCKGISVARIGGSGYLGAGVIGADGELVTVRDVVAWFNRSGDCDSSFDRRCRFFISMIDDSISALTAAKGLVDTLDIHGGSFEVWDDLAAHANLIPLYYQRDYSGRTQWLQVNDETIKDQESINAYSRGGVSGLYRAPNLELELTRDAATATDIAQRRLLRQKNPPRYMRLDMGMGGFNIELGELRRVTHYGGVGASGYQSQAARVVRHEGNPNDFEVSLELHDLGALFSGTAFLGDEATLPGLWTSATSAQRAYFYLCDETTGAFSDGSPGMRLR